MGIFGSLFGNNKKHQTSKPVVGNATQDRPTVDVLLAQIASSDATARGRAAWQLGGGGLGPKDADLKDPRVSDALIVALNDTEMKVREWAAWALQKHISLFGENPRIIEALTSLLRDGTNSGRVMEEALTGLKRHPSKEAVTFAIKLLSSQNGAVRDAAAELLGDSRDQSAVEQLLNVLRAMQITDNTSAVIGALGKIGDRRAVDLLVDLLCGRFKETVVYYSPAAYLADALGQIGDSRAIDPLISVLANAKSAMVGRSHYDRPRKNYIDVLKALSATKAVRVIKDYVNDRNEEVSQAAVAAVRHLEAMQSDEEKAKELCDSKKAAEQTAQGDVGAMSLDGLIHEWKQGDSVSAGSELARRAETQSDTVIVAVLRAAGDQEMLSRYQLLKSSGQWRSSDAGLLVLEMTRRVVESRRVLHP